MRFPGGEASCATDAARFNKSSFRAAILSKGLHEQGISQFRKTAPSQCFQIRKSS
jgi:hypothetical protein